jgi:hypothetical protein
VCKVGLLVKHGFCKYYKRSCEDDVIIEGVVSRVSLLCGKYAKKVCECCRETDGDIRVTWDQVRGAWKRRRGGRVLKFWC